MEIAYDKIITVSVLCLWFAFPIGLFLSILRQPSDEKTTMLPSTEPKADYDLAHISQYDINGEDDTGLPDYGYVPPEKYRPGDHASRH